MLHQEAGSSAGPLPWKEVSSGGKQWVVPRSLPQLLAALEHYKNDAPHLLAGGLCDVTACCFAQKMIFINL